MLRKICKLLPVMLMVISLLIGTTFVSYAATALKISKQPSSVTVLSGKTAKVTVSAKGDGLKYKWYYKDSGKSKYTRETSVKGNTYSVKMKSSLNGRQVYCVVTDKNGKSVKSKVATLKVGKAVKISKQPSSVSVLSGKTAKVTLTAKGDGLTYEWYYKDPGKSKYSKVTSVKGNTYSAKMKSSISGRKVYCVVTDKYGKSVKSEVATLKMGKAVKISKQPVSVSALSGKTAKVTLTAKGDGLTYKWYYKDSGKSKYTLDASAKSNTYSVKMKKSISGREVYCVVTDKYGKTAKSKVVTLKMGKAVKISKQPSSVTVLSGVTAKVSVTAKGDGLTYKWYSKDSGKSKYTQITSATGKEYSVKMSSSINGRSVYCVVTDKYGKTAKSKVVTLNMAKAVEISKQPSSVTADCGSNAKVTVAAKGDGLTYKWYQKSKGDSKFALASAYKGDSYSLKMSESQNGTQVYCVISDKYGKFVQTKTVTLSVKHVYNSGVITQNATCTQTGKKVFTCKYCTKSYSETVAKAAHSMGSWEVALEPTVTAEGYERQKCKNCSYYKDRTLAKLKAVWYITANTGTSTVKVGVAENGKYILEDPVKIGYTFKGWQDPTGATFNSSGIIKSDITVSAVWELDGTDTLAELVERTDAGVDRIVITADITVNQPLYIYGETSVYADEDHKLIRDVNYDGDFFIVGRNRDGKVACLNQGKAILNLGGGAGTLTIDGNRENVTKTVVGSLVYAGDSSEVNVYDKVVLANNIKNGNRTIFSDEGASVWLLERAGGAAIIANNSTLTMYGGIIENCKVNTEHTIETKEDGTKEYKETGACGGAIYSRGYFNMLGGKITGNEALRGGGVYSTYISNIEAGEISDNIAHSYGGGLATSSSSEADIYIGSENGTKEILFKGNECLSNGGALYSNTSSPITIYGNAKFENNSAASGGAIHTAGPLEIVNSVFKGNSSTASGGAIYHYYTKVTFERRDLRISDCVFENNSGNLGGAIILSASEAVAETGMGTYAEITNCRFVQNIADGSSGNGGAIYVTRKSDAILSNCNFSSNISKGNGGAIAAQSGAKATLTDIEFVGNNAKNGGGLYSESGATVGLTNVRFDGNSAENNGGALYFDKIDVTLNNVDFTNNSAKNHAGAVYLNGCDLSVDATCDFEGNRAGEHGGAFYLTYTKISDTEKDVSTLNAQNVTFKNNSAVAGGAISVRTGCKAVLDNITFDGNKVAGIEKDGKSDGDADGGAAIYVGYGEVTLNNATVINNESENYGGAIATVQATVNISGGTFSGNKALTGGAINAISKSALTISGTAFTSNESTYVQSGSYDSSMGGGAIKIKGGTLDISGVTFDANKSGYYGGTILATGVKATIDENSVIKNSSGSTGAAVYFSGVSEVTVENTEIKDNTSKGNGVIYVNNCKVNLTNVTATGNKATNGGVLYTSNANSNITFTDCTLNNNNATSGGVVFAEKATVNLNNCEMKENSASYGGAVYSRLGIINSASTDYTQNTASVNGGAINLAGATLTTTAEDTFSKNDAAGHGGAVYVSYYDVTTDTGTTRNPGAYNATGGTFTENQAIAGGAVSIRSASEANFDSTSFTGNVAKTYETAPDEKSDGDNEGGGSIYVGYGKLVLTNATATGNTAHEFGGVISAPGAEIIINGGTFSQNTAKTGGVIRALNETEVTIEGGTYSGNSVSGSGGVINQNYGTLSVKDATFSGNQSTSTGGALYVYRNTVTLDGVKMLSNTSTSSNGGALNIVGSVVTVSGNSEFKDNTASGHGAAIYVSYTGENRGNLTVTGGTFSGNTATSGAAVSVRTGCKATLTDTILTENSVSGSNDDKAADGDADGGGAIYVGYGELTLNNVTVTKNNSEFYGGAIAAVKSTVNINGGTFSENTAETGGAINAIVNSAINISDATFTSNESTYVQAVDSYDSSKGGGAIKIKSGTLDISASTFDANKSGYYGGTILAAGVKATIDENSVVKNSTGGTGGALNFSGDSEVTVENSEIKDNAASLNGVVYFNGGKLNMNNVTATGNSGYNGGVLFVSGSSTQVVLTNCNWSKNTATYGGAVNCTDATVKFVGGEYKENIACLGGVVHNKKGNIESEGSTFTSNSAIKDSNGSAGNGGAVSLAGGTFTGTGANVFNKNTAENHGGAVYVSYVTNDDKTRDNGGLIMTDGLFEENTAIAGGAISSRTGCSVNLTGTVIKNNSATSVNNSEGGGALFTNDNTMTLSGVTLEGNSSGYYGGAVTALNTTFTVKDNSVIKNNIGTTGVAFNFRGTGNYTLTDTSVTDNSSEKGSGIIYITGSGTMTVTNLTASGNKNNNGGVIYASGSSKVIIDKSTFSGNTALCFGGAIDWRSTGTLEAKDTTFSANTAGIVGGAICDKGTGKITTNNCTFEKNEAQALKKDSSLICRGGGAVYVSEGTEVEVIGGSFNENMAAGTEDSSTLTDAGGAILVDGGTLTATGVSFKTNTANNGGAIGTSKSADTVITAASCTFESNVGTKNGGGVYVQNGVINTTDSIVIKDCVFKTNTAQGSAGASVYIRTSSSATIINMDSSDGKWGWKGAVYATGGARVTLQGSVKMGGNDEVYATGSGTMAVVNYSTEEEKTAWTNVITTASSATITYVEQSA